MKYKTQVLTHLLKAQSEITEVIEIYDRTSSYVLVQDKIQKILSVMHAADSLIIKHHLNECTAELLAQKKIDEGIKQVILSYKYMHKGGI